MGCLLPVQHFAVTEENPFCGESPYTENPNGGDRDCAPRGCSGRFRPSRLPPCSTSGTPHHCLQEMRNQSQCRLDQHTSFWPILYAFQWISARLRVCRTLDILSLWHRPSWIHPDHY